MNNSNITAWVFLNNTTETPASSYDLDAVEVFYMCLFLVAFTITLITNTATIVIILTTSALRTCTNAFIVSLSASDVLFALFMLALTATVIARSLVDFHVEMGIFRSSSNYAWGVLNHSGNGNLLLVSLERWLYITQPFWYQRIVSPFTVKFSIAITWAVSLIINLPYMIFTKDPLKMNEFLLISIAFVNPAVHTICYIIMICIYIHIAFTTSQHLKNISKTTVRPHGGVNEIAATITRGSIYLENWKAVKLLITICGLFFICVSPHVYVTAYAISNPNHEIKHYEAINILFLFLVSLHHLSNFFIYAFRIPKFNNVIKRQVNKLKCCRRNQVHTNREETLSALEMQTRTLSKY